jgi:hypothetical protein
LGDSPECQLTKIWSMERRQQGKVDFSGLAHYFPRHETQTASRDAGKCHYSIVMKCVAILESAQSIRERFLGFGLQQDHAGSPAGGSTADRMGLAEAFPQLSGHS